MKDTTTDVLILAVDPGGMTGWATYWNDHVSAGQSEPMEFLRRADGFLATDYTKKHVICERYTVTSETIKKSRQYDALEVIGTLKYLAWKHGAEFTLQAPAEAKRFTPNARLLILKWYRPGQDHANDALRHLVLWLANHGWKLPDL